ncbi:MAG: hypothetical protein K8F91_12015 [Candidatus Obscuribacterales bacterium]|nr:hypothetical protein [Candidatus Obscuribacterales bacterium]
MNGSLIIEGAIDTHESGSCGCQGTGTSSGKDASGHGYHVDSNEVVYLKVKFAYKLVAFTLAVIALSWFIEGCRRIAQALTIESVGMLILGMVTTVFFVGLQAYWIYFEEKRKGELKKHIGLFESIHEYLGRSK